MVLELLGSIKTLAVHEVVDSKPLMLIVALCKFIVTDRVHRNSGFISPNVKGILKIGFIGVKKTNTLVVASSRMIVVIEIETEKATTSKGLETEIESLLNICHLRLRQVLRVCTILSKPAIVILLRSKNMPCW